MSISKFLLTASLISLNMSGANELKLRADKVVSPSRLGDIVLSHHSGQFRVSNEGETHGVQNYNVSKEIRCVDAATLKVLMKSGYVAVDRSTNGDFKLQFQPRLNGGGGIGATVGFFIGKTVFFVIAEAAGGAAGALVGLAVSPVATPIGGGAAAAVTKKAVSTAVKLALNTAGTKFALGLGIFFGAATGPV